MSTDAFDYSLEIACEDLDVRHNHDLRFTRAENDARQPQKLILDAANIPFLYLHALRGGTKGGQGVRMLADTHGVSNGMISIYFAHATHALFTTLPPEEEMRVKWPTISDHPTRITRRPGVAATIASTAEAPLSGATFTALPSGSIFKAMVAATIAVSTTCLAPTRLQPSTTPQVKCALGHKGCWRR
jgi:hypothetical protein